ncbi:hypothetical protein ACFQAQ_09885 [Novosphingobium resinovorum]|uniref:hypothetical protein n=1 Tax=Novosphingobium resinovorum TaxID=158500 RepID=UPI003608C7BB
MIHGDAHAGNVFRTPEGMGVIDWQLLQRGGLGARRGLSPERGAADRSGRGRGAPPAGRVPRDDARARDGHAVRSGRLDAVPRRRDLRLLPMVDHAPRRSADHRPVRRSARQGGDAARQLRIARVGAQIEACTELTFVIASEAKQSRAVSSRPGLLRFARNDDRE